MDGPGRGGASCLSLPLPAQGAPVLTRDRSLASRAAAGPRPAAWSEGLSRSACGLARARAGQFHTKEVSFLTTPGLGVPVGAELLQTALLRGRGTKSVPVR